MIAKTNIILNVKYKTTSEILAAAVYIQYENSSASYSMLNQPPQTRRDKQTDPFWSELQVQKHSCYKQMYKKKAILILLINAHKMNQYQRLICKGLNNLLMIQTK